MKASDDLFRLIKSLSKSEKRYFKLFASLQSGDTAYLKLFDIIEAKEAYDEQQIKKQLKGEAFIKQLTRTKNYLYNLILKSMNSYKYKNSVKTLLRDSLDEIDFLYQKGLFDQCEKIVARLFSTAEKYERFYEMIECINWQILVYRAKGYQGVTDENIASAFKALDDALKSYAAENSYRHLSAKVLLNLRKKGFSRKKVNSSELINLVGKPINQLENEATSYFSLNHLYLACYGYYIIKNDYAHALLYSGKAVKLIEKNPHQLEQNTQQYISALNNFITCKLEVGDTKELMTYIAKLRGVASKTDLHKNQAFYYSLELELSYHNKAGSFEKGIELIKKYSSEIESFIKNEMNEKLVINLYYTMACTYFGAANYSFANKYINKILNSSVIDYRNDIICFSKILSLIIHYELKNEDLLFYLIKSTYRFLLKREGLYKIENVVIQFIRKNQGKIIYNKKGLLVEMERFRNDLLAIINSDAHERNVLKYFDFISWIESKILNRSFADIVKEKWKSQQ